jgi:hypothetical protein
MDITTRYTSSSELTALQSNSVQPNTNYLKPNSFKFDVAKLPNVTYTCQSANLPALQLGVAVQDSPFVDIPHPGDKVSFGEFTIRFLINEDMSNYKELYDWIVSIGVPQGGNQFAKRTTRATVFDTTDYAGVFSDATLMVIDSNNNPVVKLAFQDLFPTSIEGLDFDITTAGMEYFVGIASFRYKVFTVEQL